jgi:hypothetical protein
MRFLGAGKERFSCSLYFKISCFKLKTLTVTLNLMPTTGTETSPGKNTIATRIHIDGSRIISFAKFVKDDTKSTYEGGR